MTWGDMGNQRASKVQLIHRSMVRDSQRTVQAGTSLLSEERRLLLPPDVRAPVPGGAGLDSPAPSHFRGERAPGAQACAHPQQATCAGFSSYPSSPSNPPLEASQGAFVRRGLSAADALTGSSLSRRRPVLGARGSLACAGVCPSVRLSVPACPKRSWCSPRCNSSEQDCSGRY